MIEDKLFNLEKKISKLKDSNSLLAIKAEFETEGTRIDELSVLSGLCCKWKIPLTLKIGGPCAKRDIYEACQFGANNILVPMVESSFSAEICSEFFESLINAFQMMYERPNLFINIESIKTVNNLNSILESISQKKLPIKSFVIGRSDLASSLDIDDVNSAAMFEIVENIIFKAQDHCMDLTLGGNITGKSYNFINKLKDKVISFESRKCTFLLNKNIDEIQYKQLINDGLEFELAWLEFKQNMYSQRSNEENTRINLIKKRIAN